jgi:hypothetical protein
MSGPTLFVLRPETVESRWADLRAMLAPGMEYSNGEFEVDDILTMVQSQRVFVATYSEDSKDILAVVFEILNYPRKCVLHVLAMGGAGFDRMLKACWGALTELAALVGASAIRGAVRPSMERYCRRVAPEAGKIYTILERGV